MNDNNNFIALTAQIASAYLSNNHLEKDQVSDLIGKIHSSLTALDEAQAHLQPAVSIEESITNDYIICLEDGKKLKMLKRYLRTRYNLSPEEYREKWGLPNDYPMVAPNYAKVRSKHAKASGLGKK